MQLLSPHNNYQTDEQKELELKKALANQFNQSYSGRTTSYANPAKYPLPYVIGSNNELLRAQAQTGWEQLGNGLRRTGAELTLGTLKGITDIPDVFRAMFSEGGLSNLAYDEFRNDISRSLQEVMDNQKKRTPIYTEPGEEGFNPFKAAWWANNMASIATGVSMMIPTYGIARGVGFAAKAMGSLHTGAKLNRVQTALLSSIAGASYGNLHESYMESVDLGPKLYKQLYDHYSQSMNPEQADVKAKTEVGERLAEQWKINAPNAVLDMIGLYSLLKPFRQVDNIISKGIRNSLIKEVVPEGLQEGVNQYSSNLQQAKVDLITGVRDNNYSLKEFFNDPNTATAMFFGALGGGVFVGGGNFFNQVIENSGKKDTSLFSGAGRAALTGYTTDELKLREKQQEVLAKFATNKSAYEQLKGTAELVGNKELYDELQSLTAVDDAITHMDNGTFGRYEKYIGQVQEIVERLEQTKEDADGKPIDASELKNVLENIVNVRIKLDKAKRIYEKGVTNYGIAPGTQKIKLYTKYEFKRGELADKISALQSKLTSVYAADEYGILRNKTTEKLAKLKEELDAFLLEEPNVLPYEQRPLSEKEKKARDAKREELEKKIEAIEPTNDTLASELELAMLSLQEHKVKNKVRDVLDGAYEKKIDKLLEEYASIQEIKDTKEKEEKTEYFIYKNASLDLIEDLNNRFEMPELRQDDGLLVTAEKLEQENLLGSIVYKKTGKDILEAVLANKLEDINSQLGGKSLSSSDGAAATNILQKRRIEVENKSIDEYRAQAIEELGITSVTPETFGLYEELEDVYDTISDKVRDLRSKELNRINAAIAAIENAIKPFKQKTKQEIYDEYFKNKYDIFTANIDYILNDEQAILFDSLSEILSFVRMYPYILNDPEISEEIKNALRKLDIEFLKEKSTEVLQIIQNRLSDEVNLQNILFNNWLASFIVPIKNILGVDIKLPIPQDETEEVEETEEAKKADIKRRRQETIDSIKEGYNGGKTWEYTGQFSSQATKFTNYELFKDEYTKDQVIAEINAKYDAEYVDAVKKGEMTKEQAMQALEEVGRKDSDAYLELKALEELLTPQTDAVQEIKAKKVVDNTGNEGIFKQIDDAFKVFKNNKEAQEKLDKQIDIISKQLYDSFLAYLGFPDHSHFEKNYYSYYSMLTYEEFKKNPSRFVKQVLLYDNYRLATKNKQYEITGNFNDATEMGGKTISSEDKKLLIYLENLVKFKTLSEASFKDGVFSLSEYLKNANFYPFPEQISAIFSGNAWYYSKNNTAFLSGVAGAGKSKVVVKGIIKSLGLKNEDVATLGDTLAIDKIIKEGLFDSSEGAKSLDSYTDEELINYLKDKKLLVIDEAPRLSEKQVDRLSRILNDLNIKTIITGDPQQYKQQTFSRILAPAQGSYFKDLFYLPYLTIPLRVNNSQISDFQRIFQKANDKDSFDNQEFLHAHNSEHTVGVSISRDRGILISIAKQAQSKNQDYVIITTEENKKLYINEGFPEDRLQTVSESQGKDWDSVFIDLPYEREIDGYVEANALIYTATSRSKKYINLVTNKVNRVETDFSKPELDDTISQNQFVQKVVNNTTNIVAFLNSEKLAYGDIEIIKEIRRKKEEAKKKESKPREDDDAEINENDDPNPEDPNGGKTTTGENTQQNMEKNKPAQEQAAELLGNDAELEKLRNEAKIEKDEDVKNDFLNKIKDCN